MSKLGDMIKKKRDNMGLSLREFAEKCNLSHSYIKNLEDGDPRTGKEIIPTLSSLEKLAPLFGMSVEDMLKETGFIQDMGDGYDSSNLKTIRGGRTYEEIPSYLKEDLREFVFNPANEEYIRLAKELRDKNIKVRFLRNTLFEE